MHMRAITTFETSAVIGPEGNVQLTNLPLPTGDRVRILILDEFAASPSRHTAEDLEKSRLIRYSLRGSVLKYDGPEDPVGLSGWEALKDGVNP